MNKKVLLAGLALYVFVVAVGGFMLFSKQSPFAWEARPAGAPCACANCTVEECVGTSEIGEPFLESYISGDVQFTNNNAKLANDNINIFSSLAVIISILYFVILWRLAGKANNAKELLRHD